MAFGFFYGAAFAIDESDDGAHGMPVDDDAREFDRTVLCAPEAGVVSGGPRGGGSRHSHAANGRGPHVTYAFGKGHGLDSQEDPCFGRILDPSDGEQALGDEDSLGMHEHDGVVPGVHGFERPCERRCLV